MQLLEALRQCELKNDALLYSLYEYIGERYQPGYPYAVYLFFGSYDVPTKGKDKENQWESEEVYQFLIGTISPVTGDYEAGKPEAGFLYPAFANHSTDIDGIKPVREWIFQDIDLIFATQQECCVAFVV